MSPPPSHRLSLPCAQRTLALSGVLLFCLSGATSQRASAEESTCLQTTPHPAFSTCQPSEEFQCLPMTLYVACVDGQAAVDERWLAQQVDAAQQHFAPVGFGFEPTLSFAAIPDHIPTRSARDQLGRPYFTPGVITVFVVARLDNVDEEGEIRGVHWRDRTQRGRRWIILSRIAGPLTLTHELGHYFGLPHSDDEASIMYVGPSNEQRSFLPAEVRRMQRKRRSKTTAPAADTRPRH